MAPKPKVSPDQVINAYYELKRKREANGLPMRGLNTQVADFLGDITPQRVGQVIKKYEAELAHVVAPAMPKPETKASTKVSKLSEPTEPDSEPRKSYRTASSLRDARDRWDDAVSHQAEVGPDAEKPPKRGGETRLPENIKRGELKVLKDENQRLRGRVDQLEARLAALEVRPTGGARLRGSPKSSPRQEQILDLLSDGKERSFRHLERELKCSGAAVRNAVAGLKEKGQVKVRKVKGKGRVQLDRSVSDLL